MWFFLMLPLLTHTYWLETTLISILNVLVVESQSKFVSSGSSDMAKRTGTVDTVTSNMKTEVVFTYVTIAEVKV